jgi:hypothetical protein
MAELPDPPAAVRVASLRPVHWWRKLGYRVGQFLRGLLAGVREEDEAPALAVLSPAAMMLFQRMPADAQRHSLRVLQTLQQDAPVPVELAVAALLHDVGKSAARDAGAYLGLWLRGPIVLAEAVAPQWLARLADARPSPSLRYALYVQLHHPAIGAAWAQAAGASALTCWLIAEHQNKSWLVETPETILLARLQAADDMN